MEEQLEEAVPSHINQLITHQGIPMINLSGRVWAGDESMGTPNADVNQMCTP